MHFEFRAVLRNIISNSHVLQEYEVSQSEAFLRLKDGQRAIEVDDAPRVLDAWFASPICFELAKIVRRSAACEIEPAELAQKLLAEAPENSFFELSVGGKGFINARPRPTTLLRFLEGLQSADASRLFGESFVAASDGALRDAPENLKIERKALLGELSVSREDDISQGFLSSLALQEELSWPSLAQLLAMQRDAEVEADAFSKGLHGSQNISWFCEHFLTCSESSLERLGPPSAAKLQEADLPKSLELGDSVGSDYSQDYVDIAYGRAIRCLAHFRRTHQRALRGNDAGLLMLSTRELIAAFFGLYNLPEIRAVLHPESLTSPDLLTVVFHALRACGQCSLSSLQSAEIV